MVKNGKQQSKTVNMVKIGQQKNQKRSTMGEKALTYGQKQTKMVNKKW